MSLSSILLLEISKRSVIPNHINMLYHFTYVPYALQIIKTDRINTGFHNVGMRDTKYKRHGWDSDDHTHIKKDLRDSDSSVSLTRNRELGLNNLEVGFMFDRKQLQRFYKLHLVQPDDEEDWTKATGEKYEKRQLIRQHEWDEEITLKSIQNLHSVCFGIVFRDKAFSYRRSNYFPELLENKNLEKYDIYFQGRNGVISEKFNTFDELWSWFS